jgi:hypothetical protein
LKIKKENFFFQTIGHVHENRHGHGHRSGHVHRHGHGHGQEQSLQNFQQAKISARQAHNLDMKLLLVHGQSETDVLQVLNLLAQLPLLALDELVIFFVE